MAVLGGSAPPPDWMARLGQGLGNNQMALLGLAGGLLGGQGFSGGFDRMASGSKIDQSRQYLARELADKKKKEEALAARKAALIRAYGPDAVEQMGIEGAGDMTAAIELAKRKPKAPEDTKYFTLDNTIVAVPPGGGPAQEMYKGQPKARHSEFGDVLDEAGYAPGSEERKKAAQLKLQGRDAAPSATIIKARHEAQDTLGALDNMHINLARAKELVPKANSGWFPITRAQIGANVAGDQGAKDTLELNQILRPEALERMANTLKGASTDTEMQEFISILADPSSPAELKLRTIERMEQKARIQREIVSGRIAEIEGGDYTGSRAAQQRGGQQAAPKRPPPQAGGNLPRVSSPEEAMKLPPGTRFIDPNGVERVRP